jgi:FMN phosphatase YigB (HAD superfamily)
MATATTHPEAFLFDIDNTLLDNDRVQADLRRRLEREFGAAARDRYWAILEDLFLELGYRDYLGALQRYRAENPRDPNFLEVSSYLIDYPFSNRLFPGSLDTLEHLRTFGPTVILSDGDVVFQDVVAGREALLDVIHKAFLLRLEYQYEMKYTTVQRLATLAV